MTPEQLLDIRKKMGLTQKDFAQAIGMKHGISVSLMECGRRQITPQTIKIIELLQSSKRKSK